MDDNKEGATTIEELIDSVPVGQAFTLSEVLALVQKAYKAGLDKGAAIVHEAQDLSKTEKDTAE